MQEIAITNPKLAALGPQWAPFRGFSLLFENPSDRALYDALQAGISRLSNSSLVANHFLRLLPPESFHVTVWDGINDGNLQNVAMECRDEWSRFLQSIPRPEFIGDLFREVRSSELISRKNWNLSLRCAQIEAFLPAPFSVRIHGDFNTNNILYDYETKSVHYIDLYRSRQYDYVQDASVFIVSNFRVPTSDIELCRKLNLIIAHFYNWVCVFAKQKEDATFKARMALALARSFFTSARFENQDNLAKEMFMRSIFLLESIYQFEQKNMPWEQFSFPDEILFI